MGFWLSVRLTAPKARQFLSPGRQAWVWSLAEVSLRTPVPIHRRIVLVLSPPQADGARNRNRLLQDRLHSWSKMISSMGFLLDYDYEHRPA